MIFLDNNATTQVLPEVVQAMLLDLDGIPRNPSSITSLGREAKQKIVESRRFIANYFRLLPEEVYFTSGGTESNYMLIQGFYQRKPGPIISTQIEHASVLAPLRPYKPIYLKIDERGFPDPKEIAELFTKVTPSFVMLSGANTETGVLLPLEEIAALCKANEVPLIIDGIGLLGKVSCKSLPKGVSAISFSGHKFHGPKGIGLAIIRKEYKIPPLFKGGHQERDMRAGTENLPGILGITKALSLIDETAFLKMETLRNYFETLLFKEIPNIEINGQNKRLPNTSNIYFKGSCAETLLIKLDQNNLIASLGSACSSGTLEPSHVLLGMGYSKERALSSLRFSLSRFTTKEEIEKSVGLIKNLLNTPITQCPTHTL